MNVSLKNNDAVSGIVKLEIVKADYADQVDKSLRSLRQKPMYRVSVRAWFLWAWVKKNVRKARAGRGDKQISF